MFVYDYYRQPALSFLGRAKRLCQKLLHRGELVVGEDAVPLVRALGVAIGRVEHDSRHNLLGEGHPVLLGQRGVVENGEARNINNAGLEIVDLKLLDLVRLAWIRGVLVRAVP